MGNLEAIGKSFIRHGSGILGIHDLDVWFWEFLIFTRSLRFMEEAPWASGGGSGPPLIPLNPLFGKMLRLHRTINGVIELCNPVGTLSSPNRLDVRRKIRTVSVIGDAIDPRHCKH